MTDARPTQTINADVIVIGGGPSGLAAATQLKQDGIGKVIIIEREEHAGGIPRHCGHPPFGMREFARVYTGPTYAARLVERAERNGVEIRTSATVVDVCPGPGITITSRAGVETLFARKIIYATGVRETPRSARLISGERPLGVINTAALQSLVYLKNMRPFRRPAIIGTELVSFSAIATCRHAGIKPVAMIEANHHNTARSIFALYPRLVGVELIYGHRLSRINGRTRVRSVTIENRQGAAREIDCDGVLLTGQFTPEATLGRCGHLKIDPGTGGPQVDQFGCCSDPDFFACGNLLRPVETAGWSWHEGIETGKRVAAFLRGELTDRGMPSPVKVNSKLIKFAMPQMIVPAAGKGGEQAMKFLQLRLTDKAAGRLVVSQNGKTIVSKKIDSLPERRLLLPLAPLLATAGSGDFVIDFNRDA